MQLTFWELLLTLLEQGGNTSEEEEHALGSF